MATLKGRLQLALRVLYAPDADMRRVGGMIEQAVAEVDRSSALLARLGEASRVPLGRLEIRVEPVEMRDLIQSVLSRLDREIAVRCQLHVQTSLLSTGNWDPQLVERVLGNLISNALTYSPPGSRIEIALANQGDSLHLVVRDQDIGIGPRGNWRLFQRYAGTQRARERKTEGAGLGLYVCRGIVEAHGGRIWAESAGIAQGTSVHVLLPRNPAERASSTGDHPSGRSKCDSTC